MENSQTSNNVVNLRNYKTQMNAQDSRTAKLLNECQLLMTDRLSQSLSTMMDKADDVLFNLAQQGSPDEYPFYFNAMREMRLKRTNIETAFRDRFAETFKNTLQNRSNNIQDLSSDEAKEVEEVDIEELLAVTNTSGKIRHHCHDALMSLDQHMGCLLDEVKVEKRLNPVYPEKVCDAFQDACRSIESGIEIKLILFKLFEKYVASGLRDIYTEIDTMLTEEKFIKPSSITAYDHRQSSEKQEAISSPGNIIKDKNYFIITNSVIRKEISRHLGSVPMPEFAKSFLFNHWSKLMMKIHIRDGSDSKAWKHAVEVIDDMVNCIGGESSLKDKRNLASIMPNLIQRLKYGMNVIPVTPAAREKFISELVSYHQNLLNAANFSDETETGVGSEDITVPRFKTSSAAIIPFMDELLADNKKN